MRISEHAAVRMSQRAIRFDDLELAELIGTEVEGGWYVRQKDAQAYIRDLKRDIDRARRLAGKRIVTDGDTVISAYHAGQAKERRLLRRA